MDIRALTDAYSVSPQITPDDVPTIAAAGYGTIICNRPDEEIVPGLRAADIAAAAQAAGLKFIEIPLSQSENFVRDVARQREALEMAEGPVLAYCASGTRSTIVWMFGAVKTLPIGDLLETANRAGYPLAALRPQLEAAAQM
ncbi:TIGR01244 family sulfur transferase [Aliiruegeria sabulilitoris]|uniref:TIGR01244 family sulfur transferase n=1 Tax=Aliiruegeria sabulilitoris TaxID=1510458 RepID=UPI0008351410|nr:TIGR01244 family sulfur transferase [Aliiruegeria sabulilitoris]NDR59441.1 TIGR01244 family phosphatase [Pseudoruegeria sp. M32A2M]